MSTEVFCQQKQWASAHGLFLHEAVERKAVNGIYGMYALRDIPANTLLASFPAAQLIRPKRDRRIPAELSDVDLPYLLATARELTLGDDSAFSGILKGFEPLEAMQQYSTQFISEAELLLLRSMSPTAYSWVKNANEKAERVVAAVCAMDPSLDPQVVLTVFLNYKSRSFKEVGIVPVLDQFNHSDRLGNENSFDGERVQVYTRQSYRAGDQLFISYGHKDLLMHAIHYNYFDPNGTHFIEPARRIFTPVASLTRPNAFNHLQKKYKLQTLQHQGQMLFFLNDNAALMTEQAPTLYLTQYLSDSLTGGQSVATAQLQSPLLQTYLQMLDALAANNRYRSVQRETLPPRLLRFYDLLQKEELIIQANRNWVLENVA